MKRALGGALVSATTCLALVGCTGGGSDVPSDASPAVLSGGPSAASPENGAARRGGEVLASEGPDLVAVDPDTGESRILLDLGTGTAPPTAVDGEVIRGGVYNATWSTDGRWLAFDGRGDSLWVMDADMEIHRLAHHRSLYPVGWEWSPADAQLATILKRMLSTVDPSTGRSTDLGKVLGDVTSTPRWSPDGMRIVYGARGGSVYSVDVQSGERSMLVRLPGENLDSMDEIEWSPNGSRIAIMNDLRPGGGRLYVMRADGSGVRVLVDNYLPGGLAWSPDGKSIAYVIRRAGADRLWAISPVTGKSIIVTASRTISDPVWSPDGSRIAFVGSTADRLRWFAAEADGAHVLSDLDELTYLSWRDGPVQPVG